MSKRRGKGQKVAKLADEAQVKTAEAPATATRALFVAVELGGDWPSGFEGLAEPAVRRVLCQQEGESPSAFADRLGSEIEGARSRGVVPSIAALACNERADEAVQDARRRIGRTLAGVMAGAGGGNFYFTASARTSGRLRHALSALASELGAEWSTAAVEASVRFGEETRSAPRNTLEHIRAHVA